MTTTTYNPTIPPPADTVGGRIAQARSYSRISQAQFERGITWVMVLMGLSLISKGVHLSAY